MTAKSKESMDEEYRRLTKDLDKNPRPKSVAKAPDEVAEIEKDLLDLAGKAQQSVLRTAIEIARIQGGLVDLPPVIQGTKNND